MLSKTLPKKSTKPSSKPKISLSDFFPKDTVYFYGFPTGEDSNFYNQVPTFDEELVSGRPLSCAGDNVKIITFSNSSEEYSLDILSRFIKLADKNNVIRLPAEISASVTGSDRNQSIKLVLSKLVKDNSLVMAQPFLDDSLSTKYMIKPKLSATLSSKDNLIMYVPEEYLAPTYGIFKSGKEFSTTERDLPTPCVVKVANSSSGDGVIICHSAEDVARARETFGDIKGTILVEAFIRAKHNICVQVGVPYDKDKEPVVIGFNEQVTSSQGNFFGGVVNTTKQISAFEKIKQVLLKEVLPELRRLGWFGIAGIDVLIQPDDTFYFIDPNLRLTATYAYIYLTSTGQIKKPIISFNGKFTGTKQQFENQLLPFAEGQDPTITIIALTHQEDIFRFNAGIQFDSVNDLMTKAQDLLNAGVESTVLNNIVSGLFEYSVK